MTKLLEKAFKAAARLPPKVQDILGTRILKEIEIFEDEARWADEMRAEIKAGKTTPLDFSERR